MVSRTNGSYKRLLSPLLAALLTSMVAAPAFATDGADDAKPDAAQVAPKAASEKKAHGKKSKHASPRKDAATAKEAAAAKDSEPAPKTKAASRKEKARGAAKGKTPAAKAAGGDAAAKDAPAKSAKHARGRSNKAEHPATTEKSKAPPALPSLSGVAPSVPQDTAGASAAKTKKVAKRAPSKKKTAKKSAEAHGRAGTGDTKAPPKPCATKAVTIDRGGLESESFPLVTCTGAPLDEARLRLSVLARPWGAAKPDVSSRSARRHAKGSDPDELGPGVRRLDQGLVTRVFLIAHEFPGHTLSLVGGYRPSSRGSMHQSARAVDLRVGGVDEAEVVRFCKTIPDTGCGYYPNSSFVHVDVRTPGSGSVAWIDAAGPGEAPRYVTQWPPAEDPSGAAVEAPPPSGVDAETPAPTEPDVEPDAHEQTPTPVHANKSSS